MKLTFGLELEIGILAGRTLPIGCYHDPEYINRHWTGEEDSTVYSGEQDIELVTNTFTLEELEEVKSDFKDIYQNYDIRKFLMNKSMGAHIHFSHLKENNIIDHFYLNIPTVTIRSIRKQIFNYVEKSYPETFSLFSKQYFRSFAKETTNKNYGKDKYYEFNFTSSMGTEWRSFNLLHLHKLGDKPKAFIDKMFDNYREALMILENTITKELKRGRVFTKTINPKGVKEDSFIPIKKTVEDMKKVNDQSVGLDWGTNILNGQYPNRSDSFRGGLEEARRRADTARAEERRRVEAERGFYHVDLAEE